MVGFADAAGDGQASTRSMRLSGEKWIEDLPLELAAVILNFHFLHPRELTGDRVIVDHL